ncbi:hypothetical protein D893_02600, partial [Thioalkalivibrio sp. ALE21]
MGRGVGLAPDLAPQQVPGASTRGLASYNQTLPGRRPALRPIGRRSWSAGGPASRGGWSNRGKRWLRGRVSAAGASGHRHAAGPGTAWDAPRARAATGASRNRRRGSRAGSRYRPCRHHTPAPDRPGGWPPTPSLPCGRPALRPIVRPGCLQGLIGQGAGLLVCRRRGSATICGTGLGVTRWPPEVLNLLRRSVPAPFSSRSLNGIQAPREGRVRLYGQGERTRWLISALMSARTSSTACGF